MVQFGAYRLKAAPMTIAVTSAGKQTFNSKLPELHAENLAASVSILKISAKPWSC